MRYQVNFYDPENGATSAIDTIEAPEGYTPERYIGDCESNADQDWIDMIRRGEISLVTLED